MKPYWIIYDKNDDYIQVCESEQEMHRELKDLMEDGGLSDNLRVVKVIEEYRVEADVRLIDTRKKE